MHLSGHSAVRQSTSCVARWEELAGARSMETPIAVAEAQAAK